MPTSKKLPLIILGITAIACSRIMFVFFDDPEGPNLLVVAIGAIAIYLLAFPVYKTKRLPFHLTDQKRLPLTILAQVIITTILYLFL